MSPWQVRDPCSTAASPRLSLEEMHIGRVVQNAADAAGFPRFLAVS